MVRAELPRCTVIRSTLVPMSSSSFSLSPSLKGPGCQVGMQGTGSLEGALLGAGIQSRSGHVSHSHNCLGKDGIKE